VRQRLKTSTEFYGVGDSERSPALRTDRKYERPMTPNEPLSWTKVIHETRQTSRDLVEAKSVVAM
jgi:hypothetical protein